MKLTKKILVEMIKEVIKEQNVLFEQTEETKEKEADWLSKNIKKVFKKHFPNSAISANFTKKLYPNINVRYTLGSGVDEYKNGISHNDPMATIIMVDGWSPEGSQKDLKLVAETALGGTIRRKNQKSVNYFRKLSAKNPEEMLKKFDKLFAKAKKALIDNKDELGDLPYNIEDKL